MSKTGVPIVIVMSQNSITAILSVTSIYQTKLFSTECVARQRLCKIILYCYYYKYSKVKHLVRISATTYVLIDLRCYPLLLLLIMFVGTFVNCLDIDLVQQTSVKLTLTMGKELSV